MKRLFVALAVIVAACAVPGIAQTCPSGANWCSGTYQYDGMGNIRAIGSDIYIYDTAGRLVSGTAENQRGGASRQDYGYDTFGNRTSASRIAGSVDCLGGCEQSPTIDPVTNHITSNGAAYDAAGNLKSITNTVGSTSFTSTYDYDALGSMTRASAGSDVRQFIYTAEGERIATRNGQNWTWTIRGLDGKVLREFTSTEPNGQPGLPTMDSRTWAKDYIWRDGLLLATVEPTTPGASTTITKHFHLDHLGTPRVVSNDAGVQIGVHAYYPFGAELNLGQSEQPGELMKFTGHERDLLASNPNTLDYMHARYDMGTMGRFLSVDQVLGAASAPQSWNRYAYVRNNPLTLFDPNGRQAAVAGLQLQIQAEIRQLNSGQITRAEFDRRQELRLNTMMVGLNLIGIGEAAAGIRSAFLLSRAGFSAAESGVITQTATILKTGGNELIEAFESGEAKELTVAGQKILVQPDMPASGFSLQGENAFVLGKDAFTSSTELTKTILHELYRLAFQDGSAASGPFATVTTNMAADFAEAAFDVLSKLPF